MDIYLKPAISKPVTVTFGKKSVVVRELWEKIKYIGIRHHSDPEIVRHVTIVNQFSMVALLGFFISGINNYFLYEAFSATVIEGFAVIEVFVLLLNYLGYPNLSSFFLMLSVNLALFYFDSYSGYDSGTFLHYFPVIMAISMMYDLRKYQTKFFMHIIITVGFVTVSLLTDRSLFAHPGIASGAQKQMFTYNCIASMLESTGILYIISRANYKLKNQLEQIINDRKLAEEKLTVSLREKEVLLAEVHHRVKNNLAVITSLLNLKMNSVSNDHTKHVLLDCRNRVASMALIHEKLYRSNSFDKINVKQYLFDLIEEIKYSYPSGTKNIEIKVNCSDIYIQLTSAIPCGLILNELITNSYKYAFENEIKGTIRIDIEQKDNALHMRVADNGKGFNLSEAQLKTESLGLMLIESLTEQLDGEGGYEFTAGTLYKMSFPMN
ncbi:MAG: sensor histidine kinase [Bacteroidia bacterium]